VSAAGILFLTSAAIVMFLFGRRRSEQANVLTWDCGYAQPTPRMQYVDASFSETLVSLFDWAVRSRRELPVVSGPFPSPSPFRIETTDVALDRVVLPLAGWAERQLSRLRALQRGPVQMYLLYVLLAVVIPLLVAR
jgi:hypothetical protein